MLPLYHALKPVPVPVIKAGVIVVFFAIKWGHLVIC